MKEECGHCGICTDIIVIVISEDFLAFDHSLSPDQKYINENEGNNHNNWQIDNEHDRQSQIISESNDKNKDRQNVKSYEKQQEPIETISGVLSKNTISHFSFFLIYILREETRYTIKIPSPFIVSIPTYDKSLPSDMSRRYLYSRNKESIAKISQLNWT